MFFSKKKKGDEIDGTDELGAFINLPTKTVVAGNIQTERPVRVECAYKGDIVTTGRVVVSKDARIEGNIKCASALISGNVKGNIVALENLALKIPAHIKGNILTKKIYIEPGVIIDGMYKIMEGNN
ncbi:polymer-forming cytoskeletal protein [uncultured Butyricimonas sp.]|uniref:polymer-forming cytoskeletal protein n=1 Tax=uncultured Butyricimonas sp. TaxID=1268785 RepID=UPI0026DA8B56|nr:polymer-forming cytoskeletal protein [uncultured Butyricimonas sp.]